MTRDNQPEAAETHTSPCLTVAVRGETRAERVVYGHARMEAAKHARRHPSKPSVPSPFALPAGIHPTPAHDLVNNGGTTLAALTYRNLYVAGTTAWDAQDKRNINAALQAVVTEPRLVNIVQQYFPDQPLRTDFAGSADLPIPAPQTVARGDVESLFQHALSAGLISGNLDTTVFNFLLPPGTVLTTDAAPSGALKGGGKAAPRKTGKPDEKVSSLEGLGGYHGSAHVGGQRYYFAIGVYSQDTGGQQNGIVAFDLPWKNVVATFYHEMQEVRTDADVEDVNNQVAGAAVGWISAQGEEIGDFPVFEDPGLHAVFVEVALAGGGTAPVQLLYSNRAHGPEVPA